MGVAFLSIPQIIKPEKKPAISALADFEKASNMIFLLKPCLVGDPCADVKKLAESFVKQGTLEPVHYILNTLSDKFKEDNPTTYPRRTVGITQGQYLSRFALTEIK